MKVDFYTASGLLGLTPESSIEEYALDRWHEKNKDTFVVEAIYKRGYKPKATQSKNHD